MYNRPPLLAASDACAVCRALPGDQRLASPGQGEFLTDKPAVFGGHCESGLIKTTRYICTRRAAKTTRVWTVGYVGFKRFRSITMLSCRIAVCVTCLLAFVATTTDAAVLESYACFNTQFHMQCTPTEIIVLESAHYGRNSTSVAAKCHTPYQRNCDLDVTFLLNRACAGKHDCSLDVNTDVFTDPCGHEEFLRVKYRCLPDSSIAKTCRSSQAPVLLDHGYIASPNYPAKYYLKADCLWNIAVQQRQTVRITIVDFELDVRKAGTCNDALQIIAGEEVLFEQCGGLGRQVIDVPHHKVLVRFQTGASSLTQRGFLIHFEAVGPGCREIGALSDVAFDHFMVGDELFANATCRPGYYFPGGKLSTKLFTCLGSFWDSTPTACVEPNRPFVKVGPVVTDPHLVVAPTSIPSSRAVIVGIILGVVSTILFVILLLVLLIYMHKRRRSRACGKLDPEFIIKVNNLHENSLNEASLRRSINDAAATEAPYSGRRANHLKKSRNRSCCADDDGTNCTLLGMQRFYEMNADDGDDDDDDDEANVCMACGEAIRVSCRGERMCRCTASAAVASPSRRTAWPRHRRSRSGCFMPPATPAMPPTERPLCRHLSLSAPDLLQLGAGGAASTPSGVRDYRGYANSPGRVAGTLNRNRKSLRSNKSQPNFRTRLF